MSKYKGHSFKKEIKLVDPPIEVQTGCILPSGMRDFEDWEAWEKAKEARFFTLI